ncbi:MAG TPA: hypothetical protein VHA52_10625 [Candidatus Babeliaceae bacterium]|nr:hypothetical protein [Candidatus Babeliaceae bacterium]
MAKSLSFFILTVILCNGLLVAESIELSDSAECFVEQPKKRKRISTSQAKRQEVDQLEKLVHDLLQEIQVATSVVDKALIHVRAIAEDNKNSKLVRGTSVELQQAIESLRKYDAEAVRRAEQLRKVQQFLYEE